MTSYNHFQSDNKKYDYKESRTDIYNPDFTPTVSARGVKESDMFTRNLRKWYDVISWAKWFPDLWYDLITPETGGIRLDLDQRVFLRSIARFISVYGVFPRGYGKCVAGDTYLFTEDGLKEIGEYFNYMSTGKEFYVSQNIGLLNRDGIIETSDKGVYSGYLDTKKIVTEEGYEIEGTSEHPLLVMSDAGYLVFKKMQDIQKGEYVAISRSGNLWGNKTGLNLSGLDKWFNTLSRQSKSHFKERNLPNTLDEDIALLIGYLIGDGCLTRDNVILFSNKDEDIVNNTARIFEEKFNAKLLKKQGNNVDYTVFDKYLRKYFDVIGLKQVDAHHKVIPTCILSAPKNMVAKTLQGLFDTDGTVDKVSVSFSSVSDKLIKQVQILLLNFGIVSTVLMKQSGKFKSKILFIYGENIDKFNECIGFSCSRKQNKLDAISGIKRNTNKDIIPYQNNNIIAFYNDVKQYKTYVYDPIYHTLKGHNQLTYGKLQWLLGLQDANKCSKYDELKQLSDVHYFYSKVNSITESKNHVYDLQMPNTHSFVSNGFISHNTLIEVMAMYHTAIFFPDIELTMTAQTKENASKLLEEKHREIIKYYPLISNEIVKPLFSKDNAEVIFTSGGRIDIMANNQSSKGARRKRINIEESALLNNALFQDVLEPIVNVPRRTIGKEAVIDPEELNGQINFFTTSGFRGSDEFERNIKMLDDMADLKGKIVLGADWQLACEYGRGETKSQILAKKETLSPIFFAMNYESKWVGCVDDALVDINKLMALRVLSKPELKCDGKSDYYVSMDVSRSNKSSNNQSSIAVLKAKRNKEQRISHIQLVNIINLPNGLNFTGQAIEFKRIRKIYKAKIAICDENGLGKGLLDELLKEQIDPANGETLECWNTINTDDEPDDPHAEKCLYALHSQGINTEIIVNFIDMVESGRLQILEKTPNNNMEQIDRNYLTSVLLPHLHTDFFVEEVANLKLKHLPGGKLTTEQLTKRVDKDRYSAVSYGLWYIKNFEDKVKQVEPVDITKLFIFRKPNIRKY